MLLFIKLKKLYELYATKFQNISCYCLSFYLVYRNKLFVKFQNISCYCLSDGDATRALMTQKFQNISCYCLSAVKKREVNVTSIFQNISCYCLSCWFFCFTSFILISKHLMLLFILLCLYDRLK